MVNILMGPEGSGKTKQLIGALNRAVDKETGRSSAWKREIRFALM